VAFQTKLLCPHCRHVRSGSSAAAQSDDRRVRFTPESGHQSFATFAIAGASACGAVRAKTFGVEANARGITFTIRGYLDLSPPPRGVDPSPPLERPNPWRRGSPSWFALQRTSIASIFPSVACRTLRRHVRRDCDGDATAGSVGIMTPA
jgi:hypothetical protein